MKISIQNSRVLFLFLLLSTTFLVLKGIIHSGSSNESDTPHDSKSPQNGINDDDREKHDGDPGEFDGFCSVVNPFTGAVIDLSVLSAYQDDKLIMNAEGRKETKKKRWLIKGWDYNTNFTMSICSSPVVGELQDQLDNATGAYYVDHDQNDKLVSIGEFSTKPHFNGKKLTMEYTNGDICPNGYDHKSTLINFVCDREITTQASFSFIGQLHNCSYFFEVRTIHACPIANVKSDLNVLGIFISIIFIFLLIEYTRRKLYQRLNNDHQPRQTIPETLPPKWITTTNDPWYKKALNHFNWSQHNDRISLRTRPSNSSFNFDIEQQNNLLDSLDVDVNTTDL